jgi:hypothetical protein
MRILDFMVFYPMAYYRRRNADESWRGRQLGQSVFLASLNVSLILGIAVEFICFLVFRINIFDRSSLKILCVVAAILNSLLFDYIYVKKKRYEYITSPRYKTHNLSITFGMTICFLLFILSVIGLIGAALAINALLTK